MSALVRARRGVSRFDGASSTGTFAFDERFLQVASFAGAVVTALRCNFGRRPQFQFCRNRLCTDSVQGTTGHPELPIPYRGLYQIILVTAGPNEITTAGNPNTLCEPD